MVTDESHLALWDCIRELHLCFETLPAVLLRRHAGQGARLAGIGEGRTGVAGVRLAVAIRVQTVRVVIHETVAVVVLAIAGLRRAGVNERVRVVAVAQTVAQPIAIVVAALAEDVPTAVFQLL